MPADITLGILLDVANAEVEAQAFQQKLAKEFQAAAAKGEAGFKEFANATEADLRQLADRAIEHAKRQAEGQERAAKEAAKAAAQATKEAEQSAKESADATKKFYEEAASSAISALGDLKDVFESTAGAIFGVSEETVRGGVKILDTTEKVAKLGEAFGPLGAAIGGTIGFTVALSDAMSFFNYTIDETTGRLKKAETSQSQWKESMAAWANNSVFDKGASGVLAKYWALEDALQKEKNAINEEATARFNAAKEMLKHINMLAEEARLRNDVADAARKSRDAIEEENKTRKDKLDNAKANLKAYEDAYKGKKTLTEKEKENLQNAKNLLKDEQAAYDTFYGIKKKTAKQANEDLDKWLKERQHIQQHWLDKQAEINQKIAEANAFIVTGGRSLAGDFEIDPNAGNSLLGDLQKDATETQQKIADMGLVWDDFSQSYKDVYESLPPLSEIIGASGDTEANLVDTLFTIKSALVDVGNTAADMIGGVAASSFQELFDTLAEGDTLQEKFRKSFARKTAESLRATGSQLIGEGVAAEIKALIELASGHPGAASSLAAAGGVAIATGSAMGGTGIALGRRAGPAPESRTSSTGGGNLGRAGNSAPSTVVQTPTIINIQSLLPNDKRAWEQLSATINKAHTLAR